MEIGLNASRINYYTANMPFKDMMKISRYWVKDDGGRGTEMVPGDANTNVSGFPTNIYDASGNIVRVRVRQLGGSLAMSGEVSAVYPPGRYHVFYEGTDSVEDIPFSSLLTLQGNDNPALGGGATTYPVSTVSAGHGIFDAPEYCKNIYLDYDSPTDASNITNMSIVYDDYVDDYKTQPFTSAVLHQFSSLTTTGGPARFQNWNRANDLEADGPSDAGDPRLPTSAMPFQGTIYGTAPEYPMLMANTLQRNPWICVPHLATPSYVSALARTYERLLDPNLTLYVERSNEVWNSGFEQYDHARASVLAEDTTSSIFVHIENRPERKNADQPPPYYPPGTPTRPDLAIDENATSSIGNWKPGRASAMWHAASSVAVFKIFKDVFQEARGSTSALKHVLAWQKGSDDIMEYMLLFSGVPDGLRDGYVHESVDYISIAPYVGNRWAKENEGPGSLSSLSSTIFDPRAAEQQIDPSNYTPDEADFVSGMAALYDYMNLKITSTTEGIRSGTRDILFRLGVYPETSSIPIISYEGGHHLTGYTERQRGGGSNPQNPPLSGIKEFVSDCMHRWQTDPRTRTWYKDYLIMLKEEFFKSFNQYSNISTWDDTSDGGWWGIQPYYGAPSAKRDGLVDYLNLQGGEITLAAVSLSFDITSSFEATTTPIALAVNQVGYRISTNNQ
jgi:hypothetical protein